MLFTGQMICIEEVFVVKANNECLTLQGNVKPPARSKKYLHTKHAVHLKPIFKQFLSSNQIFILRMVRVYRLHHIIAQRSLFNIYNMTDRMFEMKNYF